MSLERAAISVSEQSLITLIISSEIIARCRNLSLLQRCNVAGAVRHVLRNVIIIKPREYSDRD